MMKPISKLSKVAKTLGQTPPARFNSTLPITIEVLKTLPFNRYQLLLGNKEFNTRSQKKLEEGSRYWGNFGENKNGIIAISDLIKKPSFFQNQTSFLDIESSEFLEELSSLDNTFERYKEWLLDRLALEESKESFLLLSSMLLALQKGVFHLPLKLDGRGALIQFKFFEETLLFYCGFENLGPMQGRISKQGELEVELYFEKSAGFLAHVLKEFDIVSHVGLSKDITSLYEADSGMLDLRG